MTPPADDPRAEMPEQPKTTQLPAVPQWAVELMRGMTEGFKQTNANLELVSTDLGVLKERVVILESERSKFSGGVRALSTASLENEAQLAQERASREALAVQVEALRNTNETQLAILGRLDAITKNPLVKTMVAMLATAFLTWLAAHGAVK